MFRVDTLLALTLIASLMVDARVADAADVYFERDIRPILKTHCFHCHGEDGVRESGLDLRLRRWIAAGGESGPAIELHDPKASLLLQRIVDGEMPPGDKPLSDSEIELVRRWIDQGAHTLRAEPESIDAALVTEEERSFWSFQPVQRPVVPDVAPQSKARNEIDHFIVEKLKAAGLGLSPAADRRTLIRRFYIDLLGLLPSPEAIDAFVEDTSPNAVARLVDSLLASPAYGERWGRHWLDVAGYADSEGYSADDRERPWAFRYRDYVVEALNRGKPIDQFLQEQLAGDEMIGTRDGDLTAAQIEKLTATGFLRMAPDGTASGGIDQNLARNQTIADTISIVSSSLLGMTVGCARCHNHRYDPISQIDYYRMRAIFEPALDWKNWQSPPSRRISLYTQAQREAKQVIEAKVAEVEAERKAKTEYYINLTLEEELATLDASLRDPLRAAYKTPAAQRSEEQKQLLKAHPRVQNISPGSLYLYDQRRNVTAGKIEAEAKAKANRLVAQIRDGGLEQVQPGDRDAVIAAQQVAAGTRTAEHQTLVSKYPVAFVTEANIAEFDPQGAQEIAADRQRAAELRATKAADDLKSYTQRISEIRQQVPAEEFIRALTEKPGNVPATFVFYRGDHQQPKQQVEPGGLAVVQQTGQVMESPAEGLLTTGRRLAYARQLTSGQHPLVARVIVNRLWAHHFGKGIVASLGDFGSLGDRPTHPELLDWLASELVDGGWQLKRLHRLILLSATYQQSSMRNADLERIDPDNLLYGRMSVRRLESEVVRDCVLQVSGQLNRKMSGPPVPVMEDEVGQIVIGKENLDGERKPQQGNGLGGEETRRSLYVQVRRSRPLAVLETFDSPRMTPNCSQRNASNVATQSLMMMNSDFVIDQASKMARRVVREVGNDTDQQIDRVWQLACGVAPSPQELAEARQYLETQSQLLKEEHDPLASLCHALLSTNRFLYVD